MQNKSKKVQKVQRGVPAEDSITKWKKWASNQNSPKNTK